jgi:hypothetical protein
MKYLESKMFIFFHKKAHTDGDQCRVIALLAAAKTMTNTKL